MDLNSDSWDYSSEMIAKSVHMGLRTIEVPVPLLKDRNGRVSHHRRVGWFSPWQAAWFSRRACSSTTRTSSCWSPASSCSSSDC